MDDTSPRKGLQAIGSGSPEEGEADLSLDRFIPYQLSVLSNTVSRAVARIYADRYGLAIPDWRVMAVLGTGPPLSAREVCTHTAMDKVRVSRAVNRLIERDLVARKTSSSDRRRSALSLSPRGQEMYADIVPLARAAEAALLDGLSEAELDQLRHLLTRLQGRASALFGPGGPDPESPND